MLEVVGEVSLVVGRRGKVKNEAISKGRKAVKLNALGNLRVFEVEDDSRSS